MTNIKRYGVYTLVISLFGFSLLGCGSDSKANADDGIIGGETSLSIVYESTTESNGKFIGHYQVHAVDANSKPISGLDLKMSIINGVRVIGNNKLQNGTGGISSTNPISFHDRGVNFASSGVQAGDSLIILPTEGRTDVSYLGDWKILKVGETLEFRENSYHLENTEGLTYIIGNEQRLLGAEDGGRGIIAVAHIEEANATTDANGFTYFDVVFDKVLAGHTATIGVHTNGNRWGAADVISLRGGEFTAETVTVPNTGSTVMASMRLLINGTENLIGLDVNPSSFVVDPTDICSIDFGNSNFHTDRGGNVRIAVRTSGVEVDENGTATEEKVESCTLKWEGSAGSIYYEY